MIIINNEIFIDGCKRMYDDFLNSPLICFNPFEKSDEEVLQEIKRRSFVSSRQNYLGESESFCAVYNVIGTQDMANWGYRGEQFILSPINDNSENINVKESCFRYSINVDTGMDSDKFINSSDSKRFSEIQKISTINGNDYVRLCLDVHYLLDYYIPGRDQFKGPRNAYRFYRMPANDDEYPNFYRRHLTITKAFVLSYIIKYPRISPPSFGPIYIMRDDFMPLLEEFFTKNYKQIFEEILNETLLIMDKYNIPHPETI